MILIHKAIHSLLGNTDYSDFHLKHRQLVCIFCRHVNKQEEFREAVKKRMRLELAAAPTLYERFQLAVPAYSLSNQSLPAAVCPKHFTKVRLGRLNASDISAAESEIDKSRSQRRSDCSSEHPCSICHIAATEITVRLKRRLPSTPPTSKDGCREDTPPDELT